MVSKAALAIISRVPTYVGIGARSASAPLATPATRGLSSNAKFRLTFDSMNPRVKRMRYAVRGPVLIEAERIEKDLKEVHLLKISIVLICLSMGSHN